MSNKGSQARAATAMKEELLKWICMSHATNASLDRLSLRKKALALCSEAWLTVFLKRHGFSPNLTDCSGPKFDDYRIWIDLIRPLIMQYRYKDQFHVDELMMYTDFNPSPNPDCSGIPENNEKPSQSPYDPPKMHRVALLIACNTSGTEKLRPLICAPYLAVSEERQDCFYHNDEHSKITDELFGSWLSTLNRDMASNNRRILLILSRKRIGAMRYVQLTHVMPLFMPNEFPSQLRPLRRDVFHYIKMIYRTKHVERLCESTQKIMWQPDEIVETLIQAWRQVPRELIVANFQRTKFREDDCFLNIHCDSWDDLKTGVSFERYVTFDDDLSDVCEFGLDDLRLLVSVNKHKYNLRNANSRDICEINGIEVDQSESSRELEGSLKRPSDDSIDISDLQDQSQEREMSAQSQLENDGELSDQFFSICNKEKICEEEKLNKEEKKEKIENVSDYVMDDVKSSPIRNASTPINKDYDKGMMNRVYPSPERTSVLSSHLGSSIDPHCFERVSKTLENKLIDLEKNSSKLFNDLPIRQLQNLFDDTPMPSTSKEGLEESCILQQIQERLTEDHIFHTKIEPNDLETIKEVNNIVDGFEIERRALKKIQANKIDMDNNIINNDEDDTNDDDDIDEDDDDDDDDDDNLKGPANKRQRMETNWAKCYEKHLVFGPDISNHCDGLSDETEHGGLTDVIQSQMEATESTYQQ
ncbi:hypothetical protein PV328_005630 [Microctonus aethiopoides]|uniref:DDE-1 domain-containing protein n=1 Tax=Microctonus aethiopoides TaxID=144406 RepID=A0AA39FN41_9HYME|nr:hypothetical protein PV328_005630 [Microctonus aethiopoides]